MSMTLAELVARLQEDIAQREAVPSETQYAQMVQDAVADYSRRRPLHRLTTLTIVSGTAEYDLPTDFLRLIRLEGLFSQDGVIHSTSGLIPVSAGYEESFTIAGRTLTFYPTPSYSTSRDLTYAAAHVLEGGEYPDMTEEDAGIVLLKAQALALQTQARASALAGEVVEYAIGDERVKRATVSEALSTQAKEAQQAYLEAVRAVVAPTGRRGTYTVTGR